MPTRKRLGEIQRAVFEALSEHPDGRPVAEVLAGVEQRLPPTEAENAEYPGKPGIRKYPKSVRFATITAVKAGWLVKESGQWRLTAEGRAAYERYPDPETFERAAIEGYRRWQETYGAGGYTADEAAEDVEAARLEVENETGSAPPLRCWLVRGANVGGVNVLRRWFVEGFCSVRYSGVAGVERGTTRAEITRRVRDGIPDSGAPGLHAGVLHRFLNEMNVGDLVVTVDGHLVYVGIVRSDPYEVDDKDTPRRRRVEWRDGPPGLRSDLSEKAADGLRGRLTVSDLSPYAAEFARLAGFAEDDDTAILAETIARVNLPMPTQELADELLLPREWLADLVDMLNDKRQIVLYGPPGTGKTYLAQELGKALAVGSGGDYTIVQFHPSYAYEDFFEGFRPRVTEDGGGVGFELVQGPLRRLAAQAAQDPTHPYVLIIDEINRANVAKVFGELYFLLEYRGHSIQLQYSPDDPFTLPDNVFLIGTMNTADRSIALVDAAMRRRFYFQGLFPGEAPIRDVLRQWLVRKKLPTEAADLLDTLNERINDRDFAIGPSYLMSLRVADEAGLARIWRAAILPLLEEHYFGEGRSVEEDFGLRALRAVGPPSLVTPEDQVPPA
jgi:5-methylcytosine-specific restriction protein B